MNKSIRIAIVDDHPLVLQGLKDMLGAAPHIALIASWLNAADMLEGLAHELPDVLLLDIQMPGQAGSDLLPVLTKKYPQLRVLMLTNFDNALYIDNAFRNGAAGYLLKNTDRPTLVEAIETVHSGRQYLKHELRERLEHLRAQIKRKTAANYLLTPREKAVLRLVVNGCSSQQIADELFLSIRTVENYRLNLSIKLEVKNAAGLVSKTLELGLLDEQ